MNHIQVYWIRLALDFSKQAVFLSVGFVFIFLNENGMRTSPFWKNSGKRMINEEND